MKKHGLAALVGLALGSVMILDQVQAESVSPAAPASHQVQDPLQASAPAVTPAAASQEASQETSAAQSQVSSADGATSDRASANQSEQASSESASDSQTDPAALPAVPAVDLAPKANSQPPVKPVNQGISTSFYQFTESAGRGTFLAHISYGDYDEATVRWPLRARLVRNSSPPLAKAMCL